MLRSPLATTVDDVFEQRVAFPFRKIGNVHPTATIGKRVALGNNVKIGAFAIIDEGAEIGDDVEIGPHVYIGPLARVGSRSIIHTHVSIRERVIIREEVTINCGSVIGSDGFGFANSAGVNHKVPQVGTVEVERGVWIGSNVTIDRATIGVTRIRRRARIENLAQIGHNVEVGEDTVIRPQVGVAGSTRIGARSYVGEKSGINGHIEIGNNVTIFPFSGIPKGLKDGENVMGTPANPVKIEESLQKLVHDLPDIVKDLKLLRKKVNSNACQPG